MNCKRTIVSAGLAAGLLATLVLAACGGGSSGDTSPSAPPKSTASGADTFLLFPNPQVQPDGSLQTNSSAYSQAYYTAIDPSNEKDTLAKWKAANGFDSGTGTQVTVLFGDLRDLGYGRRMTGRQNPDGTVAFLVENYLTNPGGAYAYSPLSLESAILQDTRWRLFYNAIEFSPGVGGGAAFAKFFNFNTATGQRELTVDLDGRGAKAMPGACISCHGGRGDALTPLDMAGRPLFNLVQNSASQSRGDAEAHLHPFEVGTFDFSSKSGFTRASQEAALKTLNKFVLCTYPLPAPSGASEDACRRPATESEWQGTAAELIKNAYGGDGLPNAAFIDTFVPRDWLTSGQSTLYRNVVASSCRACHILRGSAGQSDIDFQTFAKFQGYSDRIKAHVLDRGNMPLAKTVFDAFWGSDKPDKLAIFLEGQGIIARDAAGAVLQPGRPVADPGPDRVVKQGTTGLSAAGSLFADSYHWTIVSGPAAGATLDNADTTHPTFVATQNGTYGVQLVASKASVQSAPVRLKIVVNNALNPTPAAIRFADIKAKFQTAACISCHSPGGSLPRPPVFFTEIDRNGSGGLPDATDDAWFYAEIRGRINFTDIVASPLLRKPAGDHHGGALVSGFDATKAPGEATRADYDLFLNWILNGAPQ